MTRLDSSFPDLAARLDLNPRPAITRDTLFDRARFLEPLERWGPGFHDFLRRAYFWNERIQHVDNPRLLDLLNVKYFLLAHGQRPPPGIEDYQLVYSGEVDIYRNPHVLPRVHVDGDGSRAQIVSYRADEVVVRAAGPGLLVLADTLYPGWHAAGFRIEPVEGLLRGVRLPGGNQLVTFTFTAWNE